MYVMLLKVLSGDYDVSVICWDQTVIIVWILSLSWRCGVTQIIKDVR
jgi:hypothetical protein